MFRNSSNNTESVKSVLPFPGNPLNLMDVGMVMLSFLASIVVSFGIFVFKALVGIPSLSEAIGIPSDTLGIIGEYFVAFLVLSVVFLYVFRKHRLNLISFGFKQLPAAKTFAYVLLAFLATFVVWMIVAPVILLLFPQIDLEQSQEIFTEGMSLSAQVLLIFYAVILGPFLEEVVFRGAILTAIGNKWGFWIGVLFSTLIWALLHFQLNVIIFTSIFGVILSYIYLKSQSLWPSYLTHVLKNLLAVIAIYALGLY